MCGLAWRLRGRLSRQAVQPISFLHLPTCPKSSMPGGAQTALPRGVILQQGHAAWTSVRAAPLDPSLYEHSPGLSTCVQAEWEAEFGKYKASPEFKAVNQ